MRAVTAGRLLTNKYYGKLCINMEQELFDLSPSSSFSFVGWGLDRWRKLAGMGYFSPGGEQGWHVPPCSGGIEECCTTLALNLGPPNTIKEYQEAKTAIGDSLVFLGGGRDGIGHIQSICKVGKGRRGWGTRNVWHFTVWYWIQKLEYKSLTFIHLCRNSRFFNLQSTLARAQMRLRHLY